jgi:hypothetical protein
MSDDIKIHEHGPTIYQLKKMFGVDASGIVGDECDIDDKALLRWPIRVWASSGEAFVDPKSNFILKLPS